MIIIKNLTVEINGETIIQDLNLTLDADRISCLLGKSGAGKTTLLKAIAGLVPIKYGTISIDGINITELQPYQRAEKIGYLFQEFHLFPHLTALQNCIDPLLVHNYRPDNAQTCAMELLTMLEMQQHIHKYPSQLSGGQKQRVAIARALALNPKLIVMDEPTASLDPENIGRLTVILQQLITRGFTVLLSSQDISFVRAIADHIYFMADGTLTESCSKQDLMDLDSVISKWLRPE